MTGWVVDLGDRRISRGYNHDTCPHPTDDLVRIIYGTWDALRCGWCGAIRLEAPR
jgi:hypothetical protein